VVCHTAQNTNFYENTVIVDFRCSGSGSRCPSGCLRFCLSKRYDLLQPVGDQQRTAVIVRRCQRTMRLYPSHCTWRTCGISDRQICLGILFRDIRSNRSRHISFHEENMSNRRWRVGEHIHGDAMLAKQPLLSQSTTTCHATRLF
jgi:hypothetical protein